MADIKKEIRIKIHSELYEVEASLFSDDDINPDDITVSEDSPSPDILDINSLGTYIDDGERVSISYDESEATGMEGSVTTVTFLKSDPSVVSMIRSGSVSTTLVFENGKRHHCMYKTPFMPFEVCVRTIKVSNSLVGIGALTLDYIVELRGAKAERTKFTLNIIKDHSKINGMLGKPIMKK